MRPINQAGLELIKSFEGFRERVYQDEGGVWTIGYGHTHRVTEHTPPVTEVQAEEFLQRDLAKAQENIERHVTMKLGDNQYAALVSLIFNAGPAPLQRMLGARLNAGDYEGAAQEFLRWRLAGGMVSDGLVRRRTAERALFLTPDDN